MVGLYRRRTHKKLRRRHEPGEKQQRLHVMRHRRALAAATTIRIFDLPASSDTNPTLGSKAHMHRSPRTWEPLRRPHLLPLSIETRPRRPRRPSLREEARPPGGKAKTWTIRSCPASSSPIQHSHTTMCCSWCYGCCPRFRYPRGEHLGREAATTRWTHRPRKKSSGRRGKGMLVCCLQY